MSSSAPWAIALLFGILGVQQPDVTGLTNADVRLTAIAKTRVSVGEFLPVRTIVTAKHRVRLCDRGVGVDVDAGRGFAAHAEAFEGWSCVFGGTDLAAGRSFVADGLIGLESLDPPAGLDWPASIHASARFVFDRPGLYRIRTRIDKALSNVVVVEAVMPTGEDARLLAALRERLAVLGFYGAADDEVRAAGERLLAELGPRPLLQPFVRHRSLRHGHESALVRPPFPVPATRGPAICSDARNWCCGR
jgi:hypothetical protein